LTGSDVPRVAIAIPAYNAAETVTAAARSVLDQTYRDFTLTVVDDGSTDGTAQAVQALGKRVRLTRVPNGGVSAARNAGVADIDSEFVAFLDADDAWAGDKLGRQVELLDELPDVGMCFTGIARVDSNGATMSLTAARDHEDFCRALLLYSSVVPSSPSTMLIRRSVFDGVGGWDRRFSQCADWDLLLRLSLVTRFAHIDKPLVRYTSDGIRMSSDIELLERDTFAVLDSFYEANPPAQYRAIQARVYSNHCLIVSGSYLHQRRFADALRCLWRGLRIDPTNVRRPAGLPLRWGRRLVELGRRRFGKGSSS
jgi:glycosyltransferase involved in cell wall biosynthesis